MPANIFDVTAPSDTQLANLLGQNIRTFKFDLQQRMGASSGVLASRWNPALDAQPVNWTGVLFWSTDTHQLFQWSGSAWVAVSTTYRNMIEFFGATTVGANAALTSFMWNTLQVGDIVAGQGYETYCAGFCTNTTGSTQNATLYYRFSPVGSVSYLLSQAFNIGNGATVFWSMRALTTVNGVTNSSPTYSSWNLAQAANTYPQCTSAPVNVDMTQVIQCGLGVQLSVSNAGFFITGVQFQGSVIG